jgi:hypothetical protein
MCDCDWALRAETDKRGSGGVHDQLLIGDGAIDAENGPLAVCLMPRRMAKTASGLRELLIAECERSLHRWRIPGRVYEYEGALKSGAAVGLSSARLMRALSAARLPCDDYCYGGRYFRSTFLLDERDQLSELAARCP